MGSPHSRVSERGFVVGKVDADANAAATYLTDAIDMSKWGRVIFYVQVGDITTNGTVDFSVTQSATSGGSYVALSPAKAITQLTEAGTDSNKIVQIEVRPEMLTEGQRYIKGNLVVAVAAADSAVLAVAHDPRFAPSDDLAAVDETV